MNQIKVSPWIGQNYANPNILKYKTLILGESNYTKEIEKFNSNMVINCVNDAINDTDKKGFGRFSTKIRSLIFGRDTLITPKEFWEDVAFYNFVQFLVGTEARQRPTQGQWESSIPMFEEVIAKIKPERVIVLGLANWNNLTSLINNQKTSKHTAILNLGSFNVSCGYINHPSSSIDYKTWQPIAAKLLLE